MRLTGFYSKPELQKLNRNSIYIFVNKRLIRDRLLMHAITEAYRNVIPPTSFPVVLLFLEMPPEEVDVNVHPAKTEVRFRQQSLVHDFVRDSLRTALIKARPAAGFLAALDSQPTASPSLMPPAASPLPGAPGCATHPRSSDSDPGALSDAADRRRAFPADSAAPTPVPGKSALRWRIVSKAAAVRGASTSEAWGEAAAALFQPAGGPRRQICSPVSWCNCVTSSIPPRQRPWLKPSRRPPTSITWDRCKPLGQLRESFILAAGEDGLWIIDQHVAHERVLFEKILRDRQVEQVQRQRSADALAGGTQARADGGFCSHRRGAGAQWL